MGDGRFLHLGSEPVSVERIGDGLRKLGRDEMVLGPKENITEGPLRDVDGTGELRRHWYEKLLGPYGMDDKSWFLSPGLWNSVVESEADVVIWRGQHPMEWLLALRACWHLRAQPHRVFEVVLPIGKGWPHPAGECVAIKGPDAVVAEWPNRRKVLDVEKRAARWEALRDHEGEWVRVLEGEEIVELPVKCFDEQIIEQCADEKRRESLFVVGKLLATTTATYALVVWRIRQLLLEGVLEAKGDLNRISLPEQLLRAGRETGSRSR